ncbi:MAG: mannitol dehydrogenase family protein [Janthinobacterium lividum]
MERLSPGTLERLPAGVLRPGYDRSALGRGLVHLGVGAFHRAHQAVYTDAVLAAGDTRWGITAASLRSADTRDALAPQDGLYALNLRGEEDRLQVIGSVTRLLVAPEDPAALVAAMAAPETRIVSLTVTEKAYCRDAASGALDGSHPDVRHDLAHPAAPRGVLGLLTAAIARRREAGLPAFTVLCCDNLPANGRAVHGLLAAFARLRDPDLAAFIAGEVACPDTMVDRIVPATTAEDRARVAAGLGVHDAWPVVAEPFTQWVIEDRFPAGRPDWASAGATMVTDVAPFEAMKLRLLNASHSGLAYLGYLAGAETVADAMAMPELARFAARLMVAAEPTLSVPAGADVMGYSRSLLARFRNPALRHRTWQIAMDGSQKLPQRILAPMADRLALGLPVDAHALVVAGWMRYVAGMDEAGRPIDVRDPMAAELAAVARAAGPEPRALAQALLGMSAIFGAMGADPRVRDAVVPALARLTAQGARRAAGS